MENMLLLSPHFSTLPSKRKSKNKIKNKNSCVHVPSLSKPDNKKSHSKYRTISLDNFMMPKLSDMSNMLSENDDTVLNCDISYTDMTKNKTKKMKKRLTKSQIALLQKKLKKKPNSEITIKCVSDDGKHSEDYHSSSIMNMSHSHTIIPKRKRTSIKSKPSKQPKTIKRIVVKPIKINRKSVKSSKPVKRKSVVKPTRSRKSVKRKTNLKPVVVKSVKKPVKKVIKSKSSPKKSMKNPNKSSKILTRKELNSLGEELLK